MTTPASSLTLLQKDLRRLGHVIDPIRVRGHHPKLLGGTVAFELALERSHRADEALKDLAATKVATLVGCEFCIDIGSMLSLKAGVTEEQLLALHDHRDSDAFDEPTKLVLDLAEGMTATPAHVGDELWAALREHFDEPALVELVENIGWENHRARTNHAFGLGAEGFSEGAACARPQAPAAA